MPRFVPVFGTACPASAPHSGERLNGGSTAVNKPTGDNARKGAVKKRSQTKTTIGGASAWTKRDRSSGEFVAVKKPGKAKKAGKKFKGVRVEKKAAKRARKTAR